MRPDVPIAAFDLLRDPRERALQALLQHGDLVLNRARRRGSTPIIQYCPICLGRGRAAYWRRGWRCSLEVVCFIDGCFLMDACWRCGAPIKSLLPTAPSPDFLCGTCGVRLAEAPSLRMAETIADQVMVYCVLACVAVPVPSEGVTSDGREYIDHLSSGVLRGTNPANAADRLRAITLEAWRHREAFARWKARARRQRRGTTRRRVRPYATAALP